MHDVVNPRVLIPAFAEKAQRCFHDLLTKPRFLALAKAREFTASFRSGLRWDRFLFQAVACFGIRVGDCRRMALGALGTRHDSIFSSTYQVTRHTARAAEIMTVNLTL
jgi:hypothetical protein